MTTILGYIAASLTTISFVPQAYQIIKTKNTSGISLGMYLVFNGGILSWLLYGLFLGDIPIILCNSITIIFTLTILAYKIKYK